MSNSITDSVTSVYTLGKNFDYLDLKYIISIFTAVVVASIVYSKGAKDSIINVLNKIVPIMAVLYIGLVIYVLAVNFTAIPAMLSKIFSMAFGAKEIAGGVYRNCCYTRS